MASSNRSSELSIYWAELRFPPLNLWVMASLPFRGNIAMTDENMPSAPNKNSKALSKLHRRLETLIAVRGGKI